MSGSYLLFLALVLPKLSASELGLLVLVVVVLLPVLLLVLLLVVLLAVLLALLLVLLLVPSYSDCNSGCCWYWFSSAPVF